MYKRIERGEGLKGSNGLSLMYLLVYTIYIVYKTGKYIFRMDIATNYSCNPFFLNRKNKKESVTARLPANFLGYLFLSLRWGRKSSSCLQS